VRTEDSSASPLPEVIPGMKEVSDLIQSYTYPLFRHDENGRPTLFASCVFLYVDESFYLVTARHALKGFTAVRCRDRGLCTLWWAANGGPIFPAKRAAPQLGLNIRPVARIGRGQAGSGRVV
jgi:hypothetical protein